MEDNVITSNNEYDFDLKQNTLEKFKEQQKQAAMEATIDSLVKKMLTENARNRLNNVRLANKEIYLNAVKVLVGYYNAGKLQGRVDEETLKELLLQLKGEKKDFKIKRK
ncbi:MAG: DNA-binding protein [archaeon]